MIATDYIAGRKKDAESGIINSYLDNYSPDFCFSFKKRISDYSGVALTVRNSNNQETDINFSGDLLDVSSLLNFADGGDVFVKTWYNQNPLNFNFIQNTSSRQPKIVEAGELITEEDGFPTINFNGTGQYLESSTNLESRTEYSLNIVFRILNPVISYETVLNLTTNGPVSNSIRIRRNASSESFNLHLGSSLGATSSPAVTDIRYLASFYASPTVNAINMNNITHRYGEDQEIYTHNDKLYLGSRGGSLSGTCNIQELILFRNSQFSQSAELEQDINENYLIYETE